MLELLEALDALDDELELAESELLEELLVELLLLLDGFEELGTAEEAGVLVQPVKMAQDIAAVNKTAAIFFCMIRMRCTSSTGQSSSGG